ncbi:MAG: M23 family metallopeptidase, partial [Bdellovibrionales bacterium]|nr:M23 family metallopeptidase [Bdellovibrionales bacterium]
SNRDFVVWNKPVVSPVKGKVIEVVRDQADNPSRIEGGEFKNRQDGNYIGIDIGEGFYAYFLHFKKGSIPESIEIGSEINVGDFLGTVGNSGVSLVPHLHLSLYYYDTGTKRYWSVPGLFTNLKIGSLQGAEPKAVQYYVPTSGDLIYSGDAN